LLLLAGLAIRSLGLEFLPKLEEGNLWIRATMPSTISLEEGNNYVNRMRAVIASFPEVESVVSQHGRPDDGTDAAGFFNAEFFAPIEPGEQMATRSRKGRAHDANSAQARNRLPGRRIQLLAIPPRQRGRGGVGRQRREFHQVVRQRSAGAVRHRQ